MDMYPIRGRYAPSPTGLLHIGNARTALAAWLSVRSKDGSFIWRVEDLDGPRVVPGMTQAAEEDLHWLGIDWDEGPTIGGPYAPYNQSNRSSYYVEALKVLSERGYLFPCSYSRKDLQELSSAPHEASSVAPYPVSLRPAKLNPNWFADYLMEDDDKTGQPIAAIRFKVSNDVTIFQDLLYGRVEEHVQKQVGDFVLKRRDGMFAYQLAVVVDDLAMEINEVVRGTDLLGSTARQIQLIEALGGNIPRYAHVPLVRNEDGSKLSKRDQALTLHALRNEGVLPGQLLGYMAYSFGFIDSLRTSTLDELLRLFSWENVGTHDWVLPSDFTAQLKRIN